MNYRKNINLDYIAALNKAMQIEDTQSYYRDMYISIVNTKDCERKKAAERRRRKRPTFVAFRKRARSFQEKKERDAKTILAKREISTFVVGRYLSFSQGMRRWMAREVELSTLSVSRVNDAKGATKRTEKDT